MTFLNTHLSVIRWHVLVCALVFGFNPLSSLAANTNYACNAPVVSIGQVSYDPFAAISTLTGTATLNCSKAKNDPASMAFSLSVDLGLGSSGGYSYAAMSSNTVRYDLLRSASASDAWSATPISGTMTNWTCSSNTCSGTATVNFYMQIPVSQPSPYTATGFYTDTRIVTPSYPNAGGVLTSYPASGGNLSIAIGIPAKCVLSSPPGNINFTYTSFQGSADQRSTSFAVSCATNTQYTMALDATSGTILGLNYTLSLNKTGTQTGTFTAQSVSITGNMPGRQSGNCSSNCTDQHNRTLTISY